MSNYQLFQNDLPKNILKSFKTSISIDTETMGLVVKRDRLCLVQIRNNSDGKYYLVQIADKFEPKKCKNLKALLENKKILKIDILKIDTEGYEFEILKGLKNRIKIIDIIFFEHHYDDMVNKSYTYSDIHNLLKKNNFEKIFKSKMPFRKTFEYIYRNKVNI